MKTLRLIAGSLMAVALMGAMTSCSDDDDDDYTVTVNLNKYSVNYDNDGVWADCYKSSAGAVTLGNAVFSHEGGESYGYPFWNGFCPSRVSDTDEYASDWVSHQWAAVTGGGVAGKGTPYMVGFWSSYTSSDYCNSITMKDGSLFSPQSIFVTNNTYAYYSMLNGSAFNKKFAEGDWYKLTIQGINDGAIVGSVDVLLADGTDILSTWKKVDLSGMGMVKGLVFTVSSSDNGEWGMNNPAYFCVDNFSYKPAE